MSDLDNPLLYVPVLSITLPWAKTWADMRPGHTDREKRERIREIASANLALPVKGIKTWGFRIKVYKSGGGRRFDIENVSKPILDAFCQGQIKRDGSSHIGVGLYEDDNIDYVKVLEITGERVKTDERTLVSIFGGLGGAQPTVPADGLASRARR